jgi:hypothetical protein
MLLNGKRLGNSGAMEAIPNATIIGFRQNLVDTVYGGGAGCSKQPKPTPGSACALAQAIAGEIVWTAGTRGGVGGDLKLKCTSRALDTCYIGRFGWIGDRVSLEDQVANAAFVEMNMTTSDGYKMLYGTPREPFPVRYNAPNCGPANTICLGPTNKRNTGNRDLNEDDIDRMADYARWLGIPTRSEFTVSLPDVIEGEKIFVQKLKCNTCHVIDKISITDPDDTMLTKVYRDRLKTHLFPSPPSKPTVFPFVSYLGTDLLMHDMGYLSHVATSNALIVRDLTTGVAIDNPALSPNPKNYVQKIRTPALKGLRFNRFVTDSKNNTKPASPPNPACDFLLHDGRACDAIEAAFLHDGPEIKALDTITMLSGLKDTEVQQLRAFLYSL